MVPAASAAVTCTVQTSGLSLSSYSPFSSVSSSASATIITNCSGGDSSGAQTVLTYTLSPGVSGNELARTLQMGPGQAINYNIYTDAAWTQIMGDGTRGTQTVSVCVSGAGCSVTSSYKFTLYGAVPPNQDIVPGTYTDTLTLQAIY